MRIFSYENVMRRALSEEAWNLVRDTSPWQHLVSNENAALLSQANVPGAMFSAGDSAHNMRINGGMQQLPVALLDEFRNCSHCRYVRTVQYEYRQCRHILPYNLNMMTACTIFLQYIQCSVISYATLLQRFLWL